MQYEVKCGMLCTSIGEIACPHRDEGWCDVQLQTALAILSEQDIIEAARVKIESIESSYTFQQYADALAAR